MMNKFTTGLLAGIGLTVRTIDKLEEFGKKIAEEQKMNEEEGKKFVDELKKEGEEAQKNMREEIDKNVKKALDEIGIARKQDIDDLKKDIVSAEGKISKLESEMKSVKTDLGKVKSSNKS
jgi:polyhydroxyalkanoate synthesis regulator phasin